MSTGTGPGGNIWNVGNFGTGSSNIWPGSNFGGSSSNTGGSSSNNSSWDNGIWDMPTGPGHYAPLLDGGADFGGFGIGGDNNGLNLAGTWASSGFGVQHGPSSGFNFFNPNTGLFTPSSGSPVSPFSGGGNFSAIPFSANGIGSVGVPGVGNPSMPFQFNGSSTSSFPSFPQVSGKDLSKIYGKGVGNALASFLNSGAGFNPGVVQALFNQAMPIEARTLSKMQTMFGDTGNAYSSTAAIGYGDFESQFNAALEGEVANQYQQAVQNYLNVLMGVKGDARDSHAQSSDWLSIASEIAKSIIPFFV